MPVKKKFCCITIIISLICSNNTLQITNRVSKYESNGNSDISFSSSILYLNTLSKIYCVLVCLRNQNCLMVSMQNQKCGLFAKNNNNIFSQNMDSVIFYKPNSDPEFLCFQNEVELSNEDARNECDLTLKLELENNLGPNYWGNWGQWEIEERVLDSFCMGGKSYEIKRERTRICTAGDLALCVGDDHQVQKRVPKTLSADINAENFTENERICNDMELEPFHSLTSLCPDENGLTKLASGAYFWTGLELEEYKASKVYLQRSGYQKWAVNNEEDWLDINFQDYANYGYKCVYMDWNAKLYLNNCENKVNKIIRPLCEEFDVNG